MNYLLLLLTSHVSRMVIFHLEKVIFSLYGVPFIHIVVSLSTAFLYLFMCSFRYIPWNLTWPKKLFGYRICQLYVYMHG